MKRLLTCFVVAIMAIVATGCKKDVDKMPHWDFVVFNDASASVYVELKHTGEQLEDIRLIVAHILNTGGDPNYNPYATYWGEKNRTLVEKMEEQWKNSDYKDSGLVFEFSQFSNLSIIANRTLWGRPAGEELADMFLIKNWPPYFSFPEGDLLPEEGLGQWMSMEQWASQGCVSHHYQIAPKSTPSEQFDGLLLLVKERVRNSWNSGYAERLSGIAIAKVNGQYAEDFSWMSEEDILWEKEMWEKLGNSQ
ncbi:MAG: hypothetical protein J6R10_03165 [Tidjanibacter sp.]|nr:hypothetical protein [Tidjanibacter sp.]